MSTPHINAEVGSIADICLLPGDPLRAKFIAEQYLTHAELVTDVRNMLGYTGYYQGLRVSVIGTGMGMPSCSIYVTELIRHYGVKQLARVGSCGATSAQVQLNDLVLAQGASTDSAMNRKRFGGDDFAALGDFDWLAELLRLSREQAHPVHIGNVYSSDLFYNDDAAWLTRVQHSGILAVEMEAAALYWLAAQYRVRAVTVLTVSDHLLTGERLSAAERQYGFTRAIELTLQSLLRSDPATMGKR